MAIDVSLQQYLNSLCNCPVEQNKIDKLKVPTRIWFGKAGGTNDTLLDGSKAITETLFDVEIQSLDLNTVEVLAGLIAANLNGYFGELENDFVLGCFVNDQTDEYQLKGIDDDQSFNVACLQIRILN